ncbi:MAG: helix-turn-helix transcriptional regulator [Candidatus Heimdallarchaeota archaeon]|nr:helix-turn-helix transcriptional regulator [Candidatus Heimdallarchaeota archaeon]
MTFKQFSSKIKNTQIKSIFGIYVPYLLACISVIVLAVFERELVAFTTGLIFAIALILRIPIVLLKKHAKDQPETRTTDWKVLRQQLTQILSESKILIDTAVELKSDESSVVILSDKQVNGNFFEENEKLIGSIRKIGIDGLLCLLFLIQQQPAIASVKAIQKTLKLPLASAYRHLQKMSEFELVTTYYTPDKPSKALYKITDEGSSLIINLYELIGGTMLPLHDLDLTESKIEMET